MTKMTVSTLNMHDLGALPMPTVCAYVRMDASTAWEFTRALPAPATVGRIDSSVLGGSTALERFCDAIFNGLKIPAAHAGEQRGDFTCDGGDDEEGLSFWQKLSIGAIISFISTKVVWAWLIGRRIKRSRGGEPPDGVDGFVDWWAGVASYVPRKIWKASKRVLPQKVTDPVDRLALRVRTVLYGAEAVKAMSGKVQKNRPPVERPSTRPNLILRIACRIGGRLRSFARAIGFR
jgi:hypothetical protein